MEGLKRCMFRRVHLLCSALGGFMSRYILLLSLGWIIHCFACLVTGISMNNSSSLNFFVLLCQGYLFLTSCSIWSDGWHWKYQDRKTDITWTVHFGWPSSHGKACCTGLGFFCCLLQLAFLHAEPRLPTFVSPQTLFRQYIHREMIWFCDCLVSASLIVASKDPTVATFYW